MTVPATVPASATFSGVQRCAVGSVSRSSRRKARTVRNAVRHSIRQSAELKLSLMHSCSNDASIGDIGSRSWEDCAANSCSSALHSEAEEFKPQRNSIEVDWSSMQFQVDKLSESRNHLISSILRSPNSTCTRRDECERRVIRELLVAGSVPTEMHVQHRMVLFSIGGQTILEEVV